MAAVVPEAHVDVTVDATTVSCHFSTRHGLTEALMDRLHADNAADFADAARNQTEPQERWHSYLQSVRQVYEDRDAARAYFDIAALGDMIDVLARAESADKIKIYTRLGLRMTHDINANAINVTAHPLGRGVRSPCA